VDENGKVAEHWDAMQPFVTETASGEQQTDGPTEVTDLDQTEANKALAVALIEDVLMGRDPARITDYISAESYAQHNPGIADGLEGIVAAVEALTAQGNMFQYTEIHAVLGEGNFVLTVSEGQWNGTTNAFYDLFRMEDGMIVEHWDVIQPVPTEGLANTNGMFTGTLQPRSTNRPHSPAPMGRAQGGGTALEPANRSPRPESENGERPTRVLPDDR
jgi:predicted SnoaL-like aldol condensation-catalyzing enzyme